MSSPTSPAVAAAAVGDNGSRIGAAADGSSDTFNFGDHANLAAPALHTSTPADGYSEPVPWTAGSITAGSDMMVVVSDISFDALLPDTFSWFVV